MDKASKYYKKALKKFHEGYIDDAIEICGISVAANNRFKAAASLKGVLFYFKGDLENARELWDFNVRVNKDVVSKKYIENTRYDDKHLLLYARAVARINEVKIADAVALLLECEKSDFNVINVSNQMASCLIKQGEFDKAKSYLDKVINIDKQNQVAKDNLKMLRKYGIIERKIPIYPSVVSLVILLIIGVSLSVYSKQVNSRKANGIAAISASEKPATKPTPTSIPSPTQQVTPTPKLTPTSAPTPVPTVTAVPTQADFPTAELNGYINSNSYEDIYNIFINWKDKVVDDNDKSLLQKANDILKTDGLLALYNIGYNYSKSKDYKNSVIYYSKVCAYGRNDSYENSLFFLASNSDSLGNKNDAIKYYEQYSAAFPSGGYEDTVLYNLALIYKDTDINKAKVCANQLAKNFSDSPYNNTNMKSILSE